MAEYTTPEERYDAAVDAALAGKTDEGVSLREPLIAAIREAEVALLRELLAGGYVRHRAGLSAIRNRLSAT